jgi:hypothetical protein
VTKTVDSRVVSAGFDRYPLADVRRPVEPGRKREQTLGALREDLKDVPVSPLHCLEDLNDKVVGDGLVEEITHAVDEDPFWLPPSKGQIKLVFVEGYLEATPIARIPHRLKTGRETFGVTGAYIPG